MDFRRHKYGQIINGAAEHMLVSDRVVGNIYPDVSVEMTTFNWVFLAPSMLACILDSSDSTIIRSHYHKGLSELDEESIDRHAFKPTTSPARRFVSVEFELIIAGIAFTAWLSSTWWLSIRSCSLTERCRVYQYSTKSEYARCFP
jgi:hypothetical protein